MEHDTGGREARFLRQTAVVARSIGFVADERESNVLKVDADLVGATGVKCGFGKGGRVQLLDNAVTCPCVAARVSGGGHAFAMGGMPGNGGANIARRVRQISANDREIELVE